MSSDKRKPPYPQIVTHNHHHAPTDESIKLLKEFEEKSYTKVIDSFQCIINALNATVIITDVNFGKDLIIKINLNGVEYIFQKHISSIHITILNKDELWQDIKKSFSCFVADSLLENLNIANLMRK